MGVGIALRNSPLRAFEVGINLVLLDVQPCQKYYKSFFFPGTASLPAAGDAMGRGRSAEVRAKSA